MAARHRIREQHFGHIIFVTKSSPSEAQKKIMANHPIPARIMKLAPSDVQISLVRLVPLGR
jgi:hypothetical protein